MIKIDSKSYHTRWFLYMHKVWHLGWKKGSYWAYDVPTKINLCFYIRAVILYPLAMGLAVLTVCGGFIYVSLILPAQLFGLASYGGVVGIILVVLGIVIIFIWSITFLHDKFSDRIAARLSNRRAARKDKMTFYKLIRRWLKDRHDKICSLMEIE